MALKAVLMEQIRLLADAGVTQFLSDMAESTDHEKSNVIYIGVMRSIVPLCKPI